MLSGFFPKLSFFRGNENTREDEKLELFLSILDVRIKSIEADILPDPHSQALLNALKTEID